MNLKLFQSAPFHPKVVVKSAFTSVVEWFFLAGHSKEVGVSIPKYVRWFPPQVGW